MTTSNNTARKRVALITTMLSAFLTPFMGSSINIASPAIGRELSMSAVLLGWVSTAYLLAAAMSLVPLGKVADQIGRKKIFTYGVGTYTLASFLSAIAWSGPVLIGFRALQGVGGAMMTGTAVAILTSVFPAPERGKALGINVAATYTGLSMGPILGGFLTQQLGWRSIFLVNLPIGLIALTLTRWKLKGEWREVSEYPFDIVGSIAYGLSLLAMMYGLSLLPAASGVWLLLAGFLGLSLFVWWELRAQNPVLDMRLLGANRTFAFSNLAAELNYIATFASTFLLSLYLQYIKDFTPQVAGLTLVARPAMMVLFSPLAGRLSDRIEPRVIASIGLGLITAGLALLVPVNAGTSLTLIIVSLVLTGLGFALFSSPNMNAAMSSVGKNHYGVASAMLGTMRLTGQMLSMGITTLIFTLYIGPVEITPECYPLFLDCVRSAFIVFAILCGGAIVASLARGKLRYDKET
jgi:EmrB/QacA subfamily drug resistance transporter